MSPKQRLILSVTAILLLVSILVSLSFGAFPIPISAIVISLGHRVNLFTAYPVDSMYTEVLFAVRMPRVLLGLLVGAALGISGAAVQGIFRNPLAEPTLIGTSAGASLFAVIIIAFEGLLFTQLSALLGYYLLAFGAFIGAALASFAVYQISKKSGRLQVTTMLLAGIAINAFAGAITGLITYMATEQQLRTITFWTLGSLGGATWENLQAVTPFIAAALIALPFFSKALNAFALGEVQADLLGMNPQRTKQGVILLSTLAVGASVAVTGIIGFVGLLVPHTVRLLAGVDHKYVLVGSMVMGALVLTLADVIARTLVAPIELPIGVITALLGTPIFLYILIKEK